MSSETSSSRMPDANGGDAPQPAGAVQSAVAGLQEAKAYLGHYVTAKMDGAKASLVSLALYVVLGIVGLLIGSAAVVTATVLLLSGIAGGLGDLMGDRYWLGSLIVGLLVIGGTVAGVIIGLRVMTKKMRESTVRKYEALQRRQHMDFGHTAEEKAHEHQPVQQSVH